MNERTESTMVWPPEPRRPHPDWDGFEQALVSTLSVLKDEFLILSAKSSGRYVQLHVSPADGVHAEAVGNAYLAEGKKLTEAQVASLVAMGWLTPTRAPDAPPPVPEGSPNFFRKFASPFSCSEVAHFVVRTLAEVHQVPGPDGLEYKSFDEPGTAVFLPALRIDVAPETAPKPKPKPKPVRRKVSPFARLRYLVLHAARQGSGLGSLEYDDNGWLTVPIGDRMGFVKPHENPHYVRVHLHLRSNVEADEALLARIHQINARLPLARVIYTEGSVYLGVDFPAVPFLPSHLSQAITALAQVADDVEKDIAAPAADPVEPTVN